MEVTCENDWSEPDARLEGMAGYGCLECGVIYNNLVAQAVHVHTMHDANLTMQSRLMAVWR